MRTASPSLSVAAAVFAAAAFAFTAIAQAPQTQPSTPPPGGEMSGAPHREMHFPPPKNLQVLPKDLTGEQVHQIMEGWAGALGTHCDTCHAPDPNAKVEPGKRPRLDFALDKKPEKGTARMMVKMVADINGNYVSKVKNSGVKVSCGTCHRGHLSPPTFKPEPEHHPAPQPQGAPGATPTPAPAPAPGF